MEVRAAKSKDPRVRAVRVGLGGGWLVGTAWEILVYSFLVLVPLGRIRVLAFVQETLSLGYGRSQDGLGSAAASGG